MWTDNTLAYNVPYTTDISDRSKQCGFIQKDTAGKVTMISKCGQLVSSDILCQVARFTAPSQSERIEVQFPDDRNFSLPHAVCKNHVTLSFLPCDVSLVDRSCDVTAGSQCLRDQKYPDFLCRSGGQQVSYSFLCDHRQDCWDDSDEDFCSLGECAHSMAMPCGSSTMVCLCECVSFWFNVLASVIKENSFSMKY